MRRVKFFTLDVFTGERFAGNPLAVIPDARPIPEKRLLAIAREFNLSETVFVYPPRDPRNTARVRIFTPARELPFAGHPTIGTAVLLASLGRVRQRGGKARVVLEEGVGAIPVELRYAGAGRTPRYGKFTTAQLPQPGPPAPPARELADALSIEPSHLADAIPRAFSCGVPFLFVQLKNRRAVAASHIDIGAWETHLSSYWAPEIFVFSTGGKLAGSDFHARMFAPGLSIGEDPATGSAVAAFAGYLAARERLTDGAHRWRIEQGFEMGRPSLLELECDVRRGKLAAVRVGGAAVIVSEGELRLD